MKKLHQKFKAFYKAHREDGNSFLLYIFIIPVLCGAVGLGIDTSMGQYVKAGIQNAADTATVAAATKTSYSGGYKIINKTAAEKQARTLYNNSRKNYPAISKSSPTIKVSVVYVNVGGNLISQALRMEISEKSPTVFLHMVGVDEFKYNIVSEARIGSARQ